MSPAKNDIDQAIDHAFKNCTQTLSYTPSASESAETKLFMLDGRRYTDVRDYVLKGMGLPVSEYEIKQKFGPLITVPPYELRIIQRALANVHDHCSYFQWNTMSKFATATDGIVQFCNDMGKYISGENLLKDQIAILSDEDGPNWTPAKRRACSLARNILNRLSTAASQRLSSCGSLSNEVTAFQGQTAADVGAIQEADAILEKYIPKFDLGRRNDPFAQIIKQIFDSFFGGKLDTLIHSMLNNMDAAVAALQAMRVTFARLKSDFDNMREYFASISDGVTEDDPILRSIVSVDLDSAVSKWYEVGLLAQRFLVTIGRST